jgi:hypothetical protein
MNDTRLWFGLLVVLFTSRAAIAQPRTGSGDSGSRPFGAVFAPAALPAGTTSLYGFAGVPQIGAGFRQGMGPLELEARVELDYFALSVAPEVFARVPVMTTGPYQIAPSLGVGMAFNSGSTYIDTDNFSYTAVRLIPGGTMSWRVAETASLLGELSFPLDLTVSPTGGYRFRPVAGAGGEIYLGQELTAGALARVGVDAIKDPLAFGRTRFAFALWVGVGYRFF